MKAVPAIALLLLMLAGDGIASPSRRPRMIPLPRPSLGPAISLHTLLRERRSTREYARDGLSLPQAADLLWAAQGLTRPSGGRTAPSAGALYPLEIYLCAWKVDGLAPGIYHYSPGEHALEQVSRDDRRAALAAASLDQAPVRDAPVTIAIAAVLARSAPRYGTRARRYVDMEVGAVAENVYLAAAALDLGTVIVGAFEDAAVKRVLGLPAGEEPLALMPVGRPK